MGLNLEEPIRLINSGNSRDSKVNEVIEKLNKVIRNQNIIITNLLTLIDITIPKDKRYDYLIKGFRLLQTDPDSLEILHDHRKKLFESLSDGDNLLIKLEIEGDNEKWNKQHKI